jgi:hypothetical protein
MSTTIATINWSFVPGSTSTLVEYRVSGTSTWIQPTSPTNPAATNTYPLLISNGIEYDVKLTTFGTSCGPTSTTFQIINGNASCCPPGYTLSVDGSYCYQVNTTSATPPSSPDIAVKQSNVAYGNYGTLIYDAGYNVNGTGTNTRIDLSNAFWQNITDNTTNSPLNRTGLWSTTTMDDQDIGFSFCVNTPVTATYYIGMGSDNYSIIRVNGTTILNQDATAMATYLSSNGYPGVGVDVTFKFWHIYPITLNAGNNVIEMIGHNVTSGAAIGAEIYNLTPTQIAAATSYGDMGAGLLFSTKDYFGSPIELGSDGIGYSCPTGFSLVLCSGPAYCSQTLLTSTISCITTTTTSTTSTTTSTTSSTTTTTTTFAIFGVENLSSSSVITNVTPVVYTGVTFPITPGNLSYGLHSTAFTNSLGITLSMSSGSVNAILFKNGIYTDQIYNMVTSGTYNFPTETFNISDICAIRVYNSPTTSTTTTSTTT